MKTQKIHHVAYRCKDAKETVEWYGKYLDMKFILAIAEDEVPSTKAPDPCMDAFLDAKARREADGIDVHDGSYAGEWRP